MLKLRITTGKTVSEAFVASYYLEKACQFQILAQSAGVPLVMPADEIIAASGGRSPSDERAWPSLLRMLDREAPSYRDSVGELSCSAHQRIRAGIYDLRAAVLIQRVIFRLPLRNAFLAPGTISPVGPRNGQPVHIEPSPNGSERLLSSRSLSTRSEKLEADPFILVARQEGKLVEFLTPWPMDRPQNWIELLNEPDKASELDDLRSSAQRGRPFGSEDWIIDIARQTGLEATLHPRGRPKRR